MAVLDNRASDFVSGISVNNQTSSALDFRASNGTWLLRYAVSAIMLGGSAGSGGGSALIDAEHSHDNTAWMPLARMTALEAQEQTARFASGPYSYIHVKAIAVYSAAETGTANIFCHAFMGVG